MWTVDSAITSASLFGQIDINSSFRESQSINRIKGKLAETDNIIRDDNKLSQIRFIGINFKRKIVLNSLRIILKPDQFCKIYKELPTTMFPFNFVRLLSPHRQSPEIHSKGNFRYPIAI